MKSFSSMLYFEMMSVTLQFRLAGTQNISQKR